MSRRRLLCTKVSARRTAAVDDSKRWKIKQVTKSNFTNDLLEEVNTHILNSDFIAVSLQNSGSYSAPWQRVLPFDTAETAYLKAKHAAERFQVLQFALCPFTLRASKLTAHPFNFHLFPRDELKIGMPSYSFSCQTSYLTSMARVGFDFNACIYDGISYLSRAQESAAKHQMGNLVLGAHAVQSLPASSIADALFSERIKSRVAHWRDACKDSNSRIEDPLVQSLRKLVLRSEEYGSRPCLDIDVCSERQVELVLEVLKDFSDDLVPLLILSKHGGTQAVRPVFVSSKDDKALFEDELKIQEEEQSKRIRGFREVIDLISASQKPVVAHNSINDFTFIHSKFFGPLPPSISDFKHSLRSFFPCIVDLNRLIKEVSPLKSLNIPAALSYLRSRFFAPIDVEIPDEGLSVELNEGKIHGHNVIRISQLFAKLCLVLKSGRSVLQADDGHKALSIEDYANIFYPCSSTSLENSGEEVSISSGYTRKLSCENLVFLWGFRHETPLGELKRLLSKGCVVVAFWKPGYSEAFLEEVGHGAINCEALREMVSDGLRAASYETYKNVLRNGIWDADLADSLEKALMLTGYSSSEVDLEPQAFEICWDDSTVINLDDL
ncbi:hypothetical protein Nepgr_027659 [Nepenthes gracilis]|uniref:Uncharacterized protein n=1 Tax=Nepenthes gracilis TaxID=150966 RepID=A0AAD3Y3S1_NEPGR|nr:hypothetical protein Nepgr_027659 [Nepenthes gracilis]